MQIESQAVPGPSTENKKETLLSPTIQVDEVFPTSYLNPNHSDDYVQNYWDSKENSSFTQKLAAWVVNCNIAHTHVDKLLILLREENLKVPKSTKTLLQTPRSCNIISVEPGHYSHLGIQKGISTCFKSESIYEYNKIPNEITIDVNIDGLPISQNSSFWPILEDMNVIQRDGVTLKNGKNIKVKLNNIICDAPAKAFILCVKGHNAAVGCNKCFTEGTYIHNCMTYPDTECQLRTNASFRQKVQEEYHKAVSPLEKLQNFDIINQIPLDYMHLVLLGVMKKMLIILIRGKQGLRLFPENIKKINNKLEILKTVLPNYIFSRKPRTLDFVDKWKATEFRQFLLYTGVYILEGVLSEQQYAHFRLLHVAIRLLCHPILSQNQIHLKNAEKLLRSFVEYFGIFYGENSITYNVHNLIHLTADVERNGPLDSFSAFRFENFMKEIKNCVRGSNMQLQQLIKRTIEKGNHQKEKGKKSPLKTINLGDYFISETDEILQVRDILFDNVVKVKTFRNPSYFYLEPYDSRVLEPFCVVQFTSDLKIEAVPRTWLNFDDNDQAICKWPLNTKNFAALVRNRAIPEIDWIEHSCQILKYCNLDTNVFNYSRNLMPLASPSPVLSISSTSSRLVSTNHEDFSNSLRQEVEDETLLSDGSSNNQNLLLQVLTALEENTAAANSATKTYKNMEKKLEEFQLKQNFILHELAKVNVALNIRKRTTTDTEDALNICQPIECLPLLSTEEVIDFEKELESEDVIKKYVSHLKLYMAARPDNSIRKCLESIYGAELAKKCAWTEAKGNFSIKDLKQTQLLEGAIRINHPNLTKDEFKQHTSNWFRRSGTRLNRIKKITNPNNNEIFDL
ncbi:hypothetical protein FQR65_LT14459 [Abscondita terminalis]|nr:hypothetical protein FQR65_LT14459 [Abscondita terminalis]